MHAQDLYHYNDSQGLPPAAAGGNHQPLDQPFHMNGQLPNVNTTDAASAAQYTTAPTRATSPVFSSNSTSAQEFSAAKPSSHQPAKASDKRPLSTEEAAAEKRRRNTLAARRFRQKQHDRVTQLEKALAEMTKERDGLKMQVARWEGETVALRAMLADRSKKG